MKTIMKHKFYLTLLLMLACVSANAQTQQHNKRAAVKQYEFPICGAADSVTSRYYAKDNTLFLSGFDTDGQGTFWFVGGNPTHVTCYNGSTLLFRRKISDTYSKFSATRVRGDSLYTVDTNHHSLIAIHKSGKGKKKEVFLIYFLANDGTAREDKIFTARTLQDCRIDTVKGNVFLPPNGKTVITELEYAGEEHVRNYFSNKTAREALYPVPTIKGIDPEHVEYVGKWRGLDVIYDKTPKGSRLRLFDTNGKMRGHYIMSNDSTDVVGDIIDGVYPMPVITCEEDMRTYFHTPDFDIIRNGHFFRVWYYGRGRKRIIVEDVDLAVAFPKIKEEK